MLPDPAACPSELSSLIKHTGLTTHLSKLVPVPPEEAEPERVAVKEDVCRALGELELARGGDGLDLERVDKLA